MTHFVTHAIPNREKGRRESTKKEIVQRGVLEKERKIKFKHTRVISLRPTSICDNTDRIPTCLINGHVSN